MIMEKGFKVTRAFIYDYFVDRHTNNCPKNNFRALKTGYNLFASGHIQSVQMATVGNYIFYKSKILPSMILPSTSATTVIAALMSARRRLLLLTVPALWVCVSCVFMFQHFSIP